MIQELEKIRKQLHDVIRSGERKNRRAMLIAFKHVDKAVRALGAGKLEIPKRTGKAQDLKYDAQPQAPTPEEPAVVLADNIPEATGPEKPKRTTKKPKA